MNRIIDAHARVGAGREGDSRPLEVALAEMDAQGVACAWVAPPDDCVAVRNRAGNELLAHIVRAHPGRFIGCAVANPWYAESAVAELQRALGDGLRAVCLYPPLQGFQLSDPLVDPLVETAIAFGAPIYAHTGTPICAEPFQLAALAQRHPRARFIMGHMGYADFWYDGALAAATVDNIWLETSFMDGDVITAAVRKLGAERFLFGSAAPLSALVPELAKIRALPLPPADLDLLLGGNAERLLP
jgi:uncharacterized protein